MNNFRVKSLKNELVQLINSCIENKVENFTLNYALNRNLKRLTDAEAEIDKSISSELKLIEEKAFKEASELIKEMSTEEKQLVNLFEIGFNTLSEEEKERHKELMIEYNKGMEEENDVELYLIDPMKIEGININFQQMVVLDNFLKN